MALHAGLLEVKEYLIRNLVVLVGVPAHGGLYSTGIPGGRPCSHGDADEDVWGQAPWRHLKMRLRLDGRALLSCGSILTTWKLQGKLGGAVIKRSERTA